MQKCNMICRQYKQLTIRHTCTGDSDVRISRPRRDSNDDTILNRLIDNCRTIRRD